MLTVTTPLRIESESFDVTIAFELIEHVDCLQQLFDILKPGGVLMLTSPLPHMDWLCLLSQFLPWPYLSSYVAYHTWT